MPKPISRIAADTVAREGMIGRRDGEEGNSAKNHGLDGTEDLKEMQDILWDIA